MDNYAPLRSLTFPAVASALGINLAKFQQKGKDWAGPCPIHNSKNNVGCFRYEIEGGRWHCFSCEAKGRGPIDLTIKLRSIGFKAAVEFLEAVKPTTEPPQSKKPDSGQIEAPDETAGELKPYTGSYEKFKVACPWLEQRIPDVAIRERYGVFCYDNPKRKSAYSGRVMIPIRDQQGVLFGYMGRCINYNPNAENRSDSDNPPKYLFPKNLPKSKFLFGGVELAVFGALPLKRIFLVESPFCVMKFASLGIPAVASYGWSVSEEQAELLATLAKGCIYLPDRNKRAESAAVCHRERRILTLRCRTNSSVEAN